MSQIWRLEDTLWEAGSLHPVGPGDWTQIVMLHHKCPNHRNSPQKDFKRHLRLQKNVSLTATSP